MTLARELIEVRAHIEPWVASLAAQRATASDMEELRKHCERVTDPNLPESEHHEADKAFHAYYGQGGVVSKHVEGIDDFDAFYHTTAQIAFDKNENFQDVLEQVMKQGNLWCSNLIFCVLHELTPAILDATERLAASGVTVVIYVITDQDPREFVKQGSTRRRIVVIPIEAALEGRL